MATALHVPFDEIDAAIHAGGIGIESSASQNSGTNVKTVSTEGLSQSLERLRELCAPMATHSEAQIPFVPTQGGDETSSVASDEGSPATNWLLDLWPFAAGFLVAALALLAWRTAMRKASEARMMRIRNSQRNQDAKARAQALREERTRDPLH